MYFPIFIDLSKKNILVVGAGNIAVRRMRVMLDFTDNITVISPEISEDIEELAQKNSLHIIRRCFLKEDINGRDLVFAATDDPEVNRQIYEVCRARGIPVNVCSDQSLCDFFFPSVITDGDVVIGINASGQDHIRVKQTRQRLEEYLSIEEKSNYSGSPKH